MVVPTCQGSRPANFLQTLPPGILLHHHDRLQKALFVFLPTGQPPSTFPFPQRRRSLRRRPTAQALRSVPNSKPHPDTRSTERNVHSLAGPDLGGPPGGPTGVIPVRATSREFAPILLRACSVTLDTRVGSVRLLLQRIDLRFIHPVRRKRFPKPQAAAGVGKISFWQIAAPSLRHGRQIV